MTQVSGDTSSNEVVLDHDRDRVKYGRDPNQKDFGCPLSLLSHSVMRLSVSVLSFVGIPLPCRHTRSVVLWYRDTRHREDRRPADGVPSADAP